MRYTIRAGVATCLLAAMLLPACGGGGGTDDPGGGGGDPPVPEATWITMDPTEPEGCPCRAELILSESSEEKTVFTVFVPGFWMVKKKGGDGRDYEKIVMPGFGSHNTRGAPDLPLIHMELALATNAEEMRVTEVQWGDVALYENILVWPQPVPSTDAEDSTPEIFAIDSKIYEDYEGDWPDMDVEPTSFPTTCLRSIPAATFTGYPVKWNPATRQLKVAKEVTYTCEHGGRLIEPSKYTMTKERSRAATARFPNWSIVEARFPSVEIYRYIADYLILLPEGYEDELAPLVAQKRTRGFSVTQQYIPSSGTCSDIRSAIQTWAAGVPAWHDAYVLLVGDTNEIPLCTHSGTPTDDLYASTIGDDLNEEVYLGRLSVDDEADCANQVAKILAYEDAPNLFCCYDQVALWAHKEGAPGKYEGAHESVRTASYSTPPVFKTWYGSQAGVDDADIIADINNGVGLVAYRGHGSSSATGTSWNQPVDYFEATDVAAITCPISQSCPVWSFACTNMALDTSDCIAERWMEANGTGAVAYYGATVPSWTSQNHELDRQMFKAVYDQDLVTISHAIEYGEAQMATLAGSDNAWMYLLLGDPDMQIRRRNTLSFAIPIYEREIRWLNPGIPLEYVVEVRNPQGQPMPGVLVGLHLPPPPMPGEWQNFQQNHYTDQDGLAVFQLYQTWFSGAGTVMIAAEDHMGSQFSAFDISLDPVIPAKR